MTELRLAMWSGPRNISTAMMRAFENRSDAFVCDEPLYAHYLSVTRLEHPGREEILEKCETDWRLVADWLTGPIPGGKSVFYQKHMAHHLLPSIEREWLEGLTHAILIRDPREMLTSLIKVYPDAGLDDTGLPQQVELVSWLQEKTGQVPPILDSKDVLDNPRVLLEKLCDRVDIPFEESMLEWPEGPRPTDGVWAKHWYAAVEKTTGFQPYRPKPDPIPDDLESVLEASQLLYDQLYAQRLRAD
ncbi:MAG: HAD family hydrolase [Planctomycetota bacterium]